MFLLKVVVEGFVAAPRARPRSLRTWAPPHGCDGRRPCLVAAACPGTSAAHRTHDLLTMQQAADDLGLSERTLRDHVKDGAIRFIDVARKGSTRSRIRSTAPTLITSKAAANRKQPDVDR